MQELFPLKKIAFLSDYIPRCCGIAIFAASLCEAITAEFPETNCLVTAINDTNKAYQYPPEVHFEIEEQNSLSFGDGAEFFNLNKVDVVSIQHEFGIYGGETVEFILDFLKTLEIPSIVTLYASLLIPFTIRACDR